MTTMTMDDLHRFAERVERLCEFFLNKLDDENARSGDDVKVLEDLKTDAADIQFVEISPVDTAISGLKNHMTGHPLPQLEEESQ